MAKSMVGALMNLWRPIPFNSRWNAQGNGLYGSGLQDRFTQLQATTGQGTLYSIVQLLSTGQAKADWRMYESNRDGRMRYSRADIGSDMRPEVIRHQALKLWKRPNPFMTGYTFREIGWQFMELVGEWYWVLNRGPSGTGVPIEMWPVRPDRMEPVPDADEFLKGWVYTGPNGEQVPLTNDEVIQLRYPHPTDIYRGLSPVQAILADIDANKYTAQWSRNFFLNSAQPGGIVTFAKRLSEPEFDEFVSRWREQHQGVARGHRVGVLEQGATWTPNTYSMQEMQFVELRMLTRDMIREAYRIHQAMLGDSTDVNRANAHTAQAVHVEWHEVTRLERTRDVLNNFYLPCFGSTGQGVELDFMDPTPKTSAEANAELQTKVTAAKTLVDAGYDPEDVLLVVGLPNMKYVGPVSPTLGTNVGTPEPARGKSAPAEPTELELEQAEAVAIAVRSAFREPLFRAEPTDEEARALSVEIRKAFGRQSPNGHRRKELV